MFAQLIASLSSRAENTTAALNELAPLLDKEYTKEKTAVNTGAAIIGGIATVAVALCWWNPFGWLGAAAGWVAAHGTTSAVIATAGTGTVAVCSVQAKTNHNQRKLIEGGTYHSM